MLDIATQKEEKIFLIKLNGRLDSVTARDFEDFFEKILRRGNRFLILDGISLDYISSAGIAALIRMVRRLEAVEGAAVFVNLNNEVKMLLGFFGLDEMIPTFTQLEEARRSLSLRSGNVQSNLEFSVESEISPAPVDTNESPDVSETSEVDSPGSDPFAPDTSSLPIPPFTGDRENIDVSAEPISSIESLESLESMGVNDLKNVIRENIREIIDEQIQANETHRQALRSTEEIPASSDNQDTFSGASSRSPEPEESRVSDLKTQSAQLPLEAPPRGESPAEIRERVISCRQCGERIRIYHSGSHLCPVCRIQFRVTLDGRVSFFEKF